MQHTTAATAIAAATIMAIGICGCTGPTQLDRNWGRSVEKARVSQTLHPDTGSNTMPVEGLDGESAMRILKRHRQGSQDKKQSSPGLGVLAIQK